MKTALKPDQKLKTFCNSKSCIHFKEKEISILDFKFYQKLFGVLISMSTILIFPESPMELENICESYYSSRICKIW